MDPAIKQMNVSLLQYFQAEKRASALFVLIGAAALALAWWFYGGEHPLRAALWPVGALGLLQLIVGTNVFRRTEGQITQRLGRLNADPAAYRAAELPRMEAVMRRFVVLRWAEITLAVTGLALVLLAGNLPPWCRGVGWGQMVLSVVSLALDLFAESRGAIYLEAIRRNVAGG